MCRLFHNSTSCWVDIQQFRRLLIKNGDCHVTTFLKPRPPRLLVSSKDWTDKDDRRGFWTLWKTRRVGWFFLGKVVEKLEDLSTFFFIRLFFGGGHLIDLDCFVFFPHESEGSIHVSVLPYLPHLAGAID